jgi:hypothetical protein
MRFFLSSERNNKKVEKGASNKLFKLFFANDGKILHTSTPGPKKIQPPPSQLTPAGAMKKLSPTLAKILHSPTPALGLQKPSPHHPSSPKPQTLFPY